MLNRRMYLVIGSDYYKQPEIRRMTKNAPRLEAGETFIKVNVKLPSDLFTRLPEVEIVVDAVKAAPVAVEQEDVSGTVSTAATAAPIEGEYNG